MPDYAKLAQTAERLIEKTGRPITLVKFSKEPEDPSKPWRAPTARVDAQEVEATGTFVPLSSRTFLGIEDSMPQDVNRGEQICLVAGLADDESLLNFNEIIDSADDTRWKIVRPQVLQPGATRLLYAFEVKR